MLKRLVSKNGRILRKNKRPEIFPKDGRFPAESGGLESQYETCTLSFLYERADAILKMERNLFEQTIKALRRKAVRELKELAMLRRSMWESLQNMMRPDGCCTFYEQLKCWEKLQGDSCTLC